MKKTLLLLLVIVLGQAVAAQVAPLGIVVEPPQGKLDSLRRWLLGAGHESVGLDAPPFGRGGKARSAISR